jgi:hypothetical protein
MALINLLLKPKYMHPPKKKKKKKKRKGKEVDLWWKLGYDEEVQSVA